MFTTRQMTKFWKERNVLRARLLQVQRAQARLQKEYEALDKKLSEVDRVDFWHKGIPIVVSRFGGETYTSASTHTKRYAEIYLNAHNNKTFVFITGLDTFGHRGEHYHGAKFKSKSCLVQAALMWITEGKLPKGFDRETF